MSKLSDWINSFSGLFYSIKDQNLSWNAQNQGQQQQLKQQQILAEQTLAAELKKKSVQLEHDIALLKTQNEAELSMLKTKCNQDLKDYKQYLRSLEQLKRSIENSYAHLPTAVAYTIHHHAKHLLNQMWEAENFEDKMHHEMQLITFMTTVHEESKINLQVPQTAALPQKTLNLISNNKVRQVH
jgi:hypothetical protein